MRIFMAAIKLSDEEASHFFTEQVGKNHPFTILHPEILKEQIYQAALYSKENQGAHIPVIVRFRIEFSYFQPRLKRYFNIHLYIRATIDYYWNKKNKGDEISRTYFTTDFYLRTYDFFDVQTEKKYHFCLKNPFEVPNFSATPTIYRQVDSLIYFLKYQLPDINENLIHFIDSEKLKTTLFLDFERPINQQINAL